MRNDILIKNFKAGGAITKWRAVKYGADDTHVVQAAAASDALIGVAGIVGAANAEDRVDVVVMGIAEVEYGGVVTRGARLTADANGKAVAASGTNRILGIAMASGVAGDIGSVLLPASGQLAEDQTMIAEVTIATAAVKTLNATPVELVAAPGANKALILIDATLFLDYAAAAYDGIAAGEDLAIKYTGAAGITLATVETTGFLDQASDQVRHVYPTTAAAFVPAANAALVAHMLVGEIATGDSPLKVRTRYKIIDTAW